MAFPGDVNSLGSVSGSQTLAAAGHATRHNEVKTALEGIRDALGGTAVPSGTVQPILAAGSASAPSLSFTGDSNTGLWSPAADTVAFSTGGTERMRIDNAGLITGTGTSLGAWTAYTPVLAGAGWWIGNAGSTSGAYVRVGKIVLFRALATFGSDATFGAVAPTMTIPVTGTNPEEIANNATARYVDSSTGQYFRCPLYPGGTGTVICMVQGTTAGRIDGASSTAPFTWASGDTILVTGYYEAA